MLREDFNYLWEQGIKQAVCNVVEEISENQKKRYDICVDLSDEVQERVYNAYNDYRLLIRKQYFDVGEKDEKRIDGHKICACITGALLDVKLISFQLKETNIPLQILYSNYAVAFLAGMHVMYLLLLSDYLKEEDYDSFRELDNQKTFIFPETSAGHDPYVQGRIKTLALNDIYGNDFDVLTYADMLYWIELYNKHVIYEKVNNLKNQ
ncbi:MAG: hypothetical protein Q4F83_16185 [Eubacteriales bacterium]|nr:hypothetical protein [Eubacteriales bacterium]